MAGEQSLDAPSWYALIGRRGSTSLALRVSLRVAAFTASAVAPASRFRVRQYAPALRKADIDVSEYWTGLGSYPPRSPWLRPAWLAGTLAQRVPQVAAGWGADVTWFQREMVSTLVTFEGFTRRPRLLDIDDAVHLFRDGRTARRLARLADLVVVGNEWLAEVWRRWAPAIEILPTAVATDFAPAPLPERPVIGWIGTASNLRYLTKLAPALAEALRRFPHATLAVCCDQAPDLQGLPVTHVAWAPEIERAFLDSLTIGLMPLDDTLWERGKCSYKMLQYMAAARPSVVSPVGMNATILAQGDVGLAATSFEEWVAALSRLLAEPATAEQMGRAGRALALSRYSIAALAPRLAGLLHRLAK
jgi:glycosyltransferase involved in cell wall biosynthesis